MKIHTRYKSDYEWEATNESGNILPIDMYEPGIKQAFSPMQLVLTAVGACAAVDMVQILKKKRKTIADLQIEAEGIRREEYPKRFTQIQLRFILISPDTSVDEFEKVVKLGVEKYCSVSASLAPDIKITSTAEVKQQP